MKKKSPLHTFTLFLTIGIFFTTLSVMALQGFIMYLHLRIKIKADIPTPPFWQPIPLLLILSTVIGSALTVLLSRMPLKPVRQLVEAINQLADGNFHVRIHLNLSREFELLSESFNRMAQELENTELLRSDFINNFSHEFKTPIVSLRGFAKILKNDSLTAEERNEYLDIIIQEANRLSQLSANVLNLSKIENMSILSNQESFNLTEQIRQSVLLLESKWENKALNLLIHMEELNYFGNKDLLSQVWINLIDNAIKFSPRQGNIKIRLYSRMNIIVFTLMDQGCGMDAAVKEHIFDRFYQGDSSHTTEGNGIGLTVVKRIIQLHKGSISAESEPGMGASFTVVLPADKRETLSIPSS